MCIKDHGNGPKRDPFLRGLSVSFHARYLIEWSHSESVNFINSFYIQVAMSDTITGNMAVWFLEKGPTSLPTVLFVNIRSAVQRHDNLMI